jgi:phosphoglucomutase
MKQPTQIVQQLQSTQVNEYALAEKYYSILSAINNLHLTKREIELVAFTAVKGSISYANHRKEFCEKYNTTTATINNIVSKLKKQFIFLKNDGKIEVNPVIVLDFKKNLNLVIKLTHEVKEVDINGEDSQADIEG